MACEALELCVDKGTAALTCAETVLKLRRERGQGRRVKFRRVRLGNKAVQERILAVDGGLAALCAAGFELAEDGEETVLLLKDGFDAARLDAATQNGRRGEGAALPAPSSRLSARAGAVQQPEPLLSPRRAGGVPGRGA